MKEGLNVVHISGHVWSTPTLVTRNGSPLLMFKLSVPSIRRQGDSYVDTYCLIDIIMWGVKARNLHRVLKLHGLIYVGGKLRHSTYMSKKEKKEVTKSQVEADQVLLLGSNPKR